MTSRPVLAVLLVCCVAVSCHSTAGPDEVCAGFPDWQTSPWVLPYPAGRSYVVDQANCSPPGNGHRGANRYGYDFLMPIGTVVTAARGGVVRSVEESFVDGDTALTGHDNYLVIGRADGTADLYGHFTQNGVRVAVGDTVQAGDTVGMSGNTGNTGNKPHLHFSAQACNPVTGGSAGCPTLPVTFRNTSANPSGLQRGSSYTAQ